MKFYLMAGDDIKKLSPKYKFQLTDITSIVDPALKLRFGQLQNEFALTWVPNHQRLKNELATSNTKDASARLFQCKVTLCEPVLAQHESTHDLVERISATYQFLTRDINTPLINRTRAIFSSNINRHLTLRTIARQLGVNEQRINKVFTNAFGYSAKLWVRKYRIYQACKLIAETNDSITSIAHAMGFSAASNFTPAFSKEIGMSPRDFKKLMSQL